MNAYLTLAIFAIIASAATIAKEAKYTTQYDDMDVDSIIKSKRILDGYVNCFLDKGKCTPAGAEARRNIPEALQNKCAKCSAKQKENVRKIAKYLYEREPEAFTDLAAKYDPNGKYNAIYMEMAQQMG